VEAEVQSRFPDFDVPSGLQVLARTGTGQARLENMIEMHQIKEKLARDGCPMSMTVL